MRETGLNCLGLLLLAAGAVPCLWATMEPPFDQAGVPHVTLAQARVYLAVALALFALGLLSLFAARRQRAPGP